MNLAVSVTKVTDEKNPKLRATAVISVDDCCRLVGWKVIEDQNGGLFVGNPQRKVESHGKKRLADACYATNEDTEQAIKNLILKAYSSPEQAAAMELGDGPAKMEARLHINRGRVIKATGKLMIGGCIKVPDVWVIQDQQTLSVSYPKVYGTNEDLFCPIGSHKAILEHNLKQQAVKFHPALSALIDPSEDPYRRAKELISEFFVREFEEPADEGDFERLDRIQICYTTTEDELTEIRCFADLLNFRLYTCLGDDLIIARMEQYDSLEQMEQDVLPYLDFDELTSISDEEIEVLDQKLTDAFNRSMATGGTGGKLLDCLEKENEK